MANFKSYILLLFSAVSLLGCTAPPVKVNRQSSTASWPLPVRPDRLVGVTSSDWSIFLDSIIFDVKHVVTNDTARSATHERAIPCGGSIS